MVLLLRSLTWPWWLRWTGSALLLTVAALCVAAGAGTGWSLTLVAGIAAGCVFLTGLTTFLQNRGRRPYVAALGQLDRDRMSDVVRTLQGGRVSEDPFVVAAAVRLGTVYVAAQDRRVGLPWLLLIGAAGFGASSALHFARGDAVLGACFLALAGYWVIQVWGVRRQTAAIRARVQMLQSLENRR